MTLTVIFKDIENAEHTAALWFEQEYAKLYNAQPTIEKVADVAFAYAIPAVQILVTATAGAPAAAIVGQVATEAQKDLLVVSALIHDFGPSPNAAGIISTVSSDLSGLLTAGHITDAAHVAIITKIVNTLAVVAAAILKAVPAAPAAQQAA